MEHSCWDTTIFYMESTTHWPASPRSWPPQARLIHWWIDRRPFFQGAQWWLGDVVIGAQNSEVSRVWRCLDGKIWQSMINDRRSDKLHACKYPHGLYILYILCQTLNQRVDGFYDLQQLIPCCLIMFVILVILSRCLLRKGHPQAACKSWANNEVRCFFSRFYLIYKWVYHQNDHLL